MELVLGSTSPYRKELLSRLNLPFRCENSKVDEDILKGQISDPFELAGKLAREKAASVLKDNPSCLIIGGDQIATIDGAILDKPGNIKKAKKQLQKLRGRSHQLITAVCLMTDQKVVEFSNITTLKMKTLSDEEIENYLNLDRPFGCAGSYMIETAGIALFEKIETTDFTSIIGLPLMELATELKAFGLCPFNKKLL